MNQPFTPFSAIQEAFRTPWKARNELERWLLLPLARVQFALAGVAWGKGWRLYGLPIIQRHTASTLTLGDYAELRSTVRSNPLGATHPCILSTREATSRLSIGAHFGMTGGAIVCANHIQIGDYVTVGCNTIIADTDFHPLTVQTRLTDFLQGESQPITIEDHVFIGMHCLILKGVTIGKGSVIGAASVVTKDVPSGVVAAGNPARVLRELEA